MIWRWIRRGFLIFFLVIVAVGIWQRERLQRLAATVTVFAEDQIVQNFSQMNALFLTTPIQVTTTPQPLARGADFVSPEGWDNWLERRKVTGVIVLKDGKIVQEDYLLGTTQEDQRISWSLAKSYLSALFGILYHQGVIDSLEDPVTKYAPEFEGTAYENARIVDVLRMSTGVVFDEDVDDFWSDLNRMGRILALGGSMDGFTTGLTETDHPPGAFWRYVSIDTHVLSIVLRRATGQSIPDLMVEHVLDPMGTYGEPYYLTDGYGVAFALGGLNLTLRDYARLGELYRNNGRLFGKQIVPEDWVLESTKPSAKTEPGKLQYGYQWWMPSDARTGEFMARGIYGQFVYVDRESKTVIAVTAADLTARQPGATDEAIAMFRRVASQ